jgi:hypothetical protein
VVRLEFEDLVEGASFGPFPYRLTEDLCDRLRGPVGEVRRGSKAPPAAIYVLLLHAYADAFEGIPAGGVLVSEGVECVESIESDAEVDVTVTIEELRRGPRRPRVMVSFRITSPGDLLCALGHMEISWANPSELAVEAGI